MANLSDLDKIQLLKKTSTGKFYYVDANGKYQEFTTGGSSPTTGIEVKSKTFSLDANDIENNLPMTLELESADNCIIVSVVYDFKVNGGTGIVFNFGQNGIRVENTYSFAPTNADKLVSLTSTSSINLSNEYELSIVNLDSIDPLTTLDITIYYIVK